MLPKDPNTGKIVDEWKLFFDSNKGSIDEIDVSLGISAAMTVKDASEQANMKTSSSLTAGLMQKFFVEEMSRIIDDDRKVKHSSITDMIIRKTDDYTYLQNVAKLPSDVITQNTQRLDTNHSSILNL